MNGFPSPVPRGYSTIVPRAIFSTLPRGNFRFLSTSFFFDPSSQNYRGFCSRQLVETAWLQGLLSRFSLLFPPLQNSRGSPKRRLRCRNRRCRKSPDFRLPPNRALSRCRSPFSLQLLPAISARCRHCRRLFPMRPPAGNLRVLSEPLVFPRGSSVSLLRGMREFPLGEVPAGKR